MTRVGASYKRQPAGEAAAQRDAADRQRERHEAKEAGLGPTPARPDGTDGPRPSRRCGRAARGSGGHVRGRSRRQRTWPTCSSSPIRDRRDAGHGVTVDVRPVRAAEILHVPGAATERQDGMLGGREGILHDDRVVHVAPQGRDRVEREDVPGRRLTARRLQDDEPAQRRGGLACRRPEIAQQGSDHPVQEDIQEQQERQADDPEHQQQGVHSGSPARPAGPRAWCRRRGSCRPDRGRPRSRPRRSRASRSCSRDPCTRASRGVRRCGRDGGSPDRRPGRGRCPERGRCAGSRPGCR